MNYNINITFIGNTNYGFSLESKQEPLFSKDITIIHSERRKLIFNMKNILMIEVTII